MGCARKRVFEHNRKSKKRDVTMKTVMVIKDALFGLNDVIESFQKLGWRTVLFSHTDLLKNQSKNLEEAFWNQTKEEGVERVFSLNYYPIISECCQKQQIKYLSMVYDCPHIALFHYSIINPCNYVFIFDYSMYQKLKQEQIDTVYYMPLAVNVERLERLFAVGGYQRTYNISFVGSLYNEEHNLYDRLCSRLNGKDEFLKGYLDAIVEAQSRIDGYFFAEEMLTRDIVERIYRAYPYEPSKGNVVDKRYVYAAYFLGRKATEKARMQLLGILSEQQEVTLFTRQKSTGLPKVENRGIADYEKEMPWVFRNSKINLNITMKGIPTGIPLRAMDIMGAGGFLLTNYQEDFLRHFVPGEDFVYYTGAEICR